MPHKDPDEKRRYDRDYRNENPATVRRNAARNRWNLKTKVLLAYSGNPPRCACCGEWRVEFLVIDHENGGGNVDRKRFGEGGGATTYRRLVKEGFPPGFRVLCWNCNAATGLYGACPHADSSREMVALKRLLAPPGGRRMSDEARRKASETKTRLWASKRGFDTPSREQLEADRSTMSQSAISRKYGVARQTIRRWMRAP